MIAIVIVRVPALGMMEIVAAHPIVMMALVMTMRAAQIVLKTVALAWNSVMDMTVQALVVRKRTPAIGLTTATVIAVAPARGTLLTATQ
jgi:uncharacterized membrane protein